MTDDRGTYERERRAAEEPVAPLPIAPNTVTGGGTFIAPPPQVTTEVEEAEEVADEIADPVKERSHTLPAGEDFNEPSQHTAAGETLVSEIQRETGVDGGHLARGEGGRFVIGGGATAQSEGDQCTLYDAPRSDAAQLGSTLRDTHLVLIEGPHAAQGEEWWNVQLPDGRTGWIPAACLGPDPFQEEA